MPELRLKPQEGGCKTADFDPIRYQSGITLSDNFTNTMTPLLEGESMVSFVTKIVSLIQERVDSPEGACYHQSVIYGDMAFEAIDNGSTIMLIMPED